MFTAVENMPGDSRVWIYQSDRLLTDDEEKNVLENALEFVNGWTAHNINLKASFEIRYHAFLIFYIDEKQALASGCSIDKSVHFIQKVEKEFSLSLMNRMIFSFMNNKKIYFLKRNDFATFVEAGKIKDDTLVFNNLVQTKDEMNSNWEIPFSKSWHKSLV